MYCIINIKIIIFHNYYWFFTFGNKIFKIEKEKKKRKSLKLQSYHCIVLDFVKFWIIVIIVVVNVWLENNWNNSNKPPKCTLVDLKFAIRIFHLNLVYLKIYKFAAVTQLTGWIWLMMYLLFICGHHCQQTHYENHQQRQ